VTIAHWDRPSVQAIVTVRAPPPELLLTLMYSARSTQFTTSCHVAVPRYLLHAQPDGIRLTSGKLEIEGGIGSSTTSVSAPFPYAGPGSQLTNGRLTLQGE